MGCGRGMTCHGLKGGVGSASRVMTLDGEKYTLGVLVQSNHGRLQVLLRRVGPSAGRFSANCRKAPRTRAAAS